MDRKDILYLIGIAGAAFLLTGIVFFITSDIRFGVLTIVLFLNAWFVMGALYIISRNK